MLNKLDEALNILISFLNADNQGINKESLIQSESYKDLKKLIKIIQTDTNQLLLLYYQEMISIQNSIKAGDSGNLFCRAYYHAKDEMLCVEGNFKRNIL